MAWQEDLATEEEVAEDKSIRMDIPCNGLYAFIDKMYEQGYHGT